MTKQSVLENINVREVSTVLAKHWINLNDEETQEVCLEEIYESLARSQPLPEDFALLSSEAKSQYEVEVDMLLITIDYVDLEPLIFDTDTNETFFWDQVTCKDSKKNQNIYKVVFV